jgi:very-short-patch-repair endonuclease
MKRKKSYNEIKEYVEKENYKLISKEYINSSTKLKMICDKGHECEISFGNFKYGKRCRQCYIESKKWTTEYIENYLAEYGYKLIKEVKKVSKGTRRFLLECPEGHQYEVNFSKFKLGRRCPTCQNQTFSLEYVKEYIEKEGYELLEDTYVNSITEMKLRHKRCGNIVFSTFHGFKNGEKRCLICKDRVYRGEEAIKQHLNNLNIDFVSQKRFKDCKDMQTLPFDMYVPLYNLVIEYDGEQHFDIKHSFDKSKFWVTIYHDAIKNAYCEDNNINILRIPYWEYENINTLIDKEINKLKTFND